MSKLRKPTVIAVIENGETRCGLTTAIRGLGGIPYRLHKRAVGGDGRPLPLFENMKLQSEISAEEYRGYLDHPENADDFNALIEIDVDHNMIRVDEDMGEEREYHEFPIDFLMEKTEHFKWRFSMPGPNAISRRDIYELLRDYSPEPLDRGMTMGNMSR